jgi:hypothetical protein
MSWTGAIRLIAVVAAFHAAAAALCLVLFLAASAAGVFGGVSILFYRGLAELVAIAPALLIGLIALVRRPALSRHLTVRDAVGATLVAVSLNLTFFVLGPVTVDRSVSVFMLSSIAEARTPPTAADLRSAFSERYLVEWDQVGRRLREQMASGNIDRSSGDHYRLTEQGRSFMRTAQFISRLFGGDPRFVGLEQRHQHAASDGRGSGTQAQFAPHD